MDKIEFIGSQNTKLAARIDLPDGEIIAYALFAHCFTCSKDVFAASRISRALREKNIAVLRFDFTGLGASEGEFANTNFTSNVQDLIKAFDFMRDKFQAPDILIGHSLGGAAVLAAAKHVPEARAVVTIGAPSDAAHVVHNFGDKEADILEHGEAEVSLAGRPFKIKKQFLEDIQKQTLFEDIQKLNKALLVMHAPLDDTVSIDNATKIFVSAKHPKSFVSLDNADHLLTKQRDSQYAADVIASWVSRYLEKPEQNVRSKPPKGKTIATLTGRGKFQTRLEVDNHTIIADEPTNYGGLNTGPTPYDLLEMSLAACKVMTMNMYAEHKKYPLDEVTVTVEHTRDHGTDCPMDNADDHIDHLNYSVDLKGDDLTEEQKEKIKAIAKKCPVHKTLSQPIKISELKE